MERAAMSKKMIPYKPKLCFCVKFTKEERIYSRNQNGFTYAEMRGVPKRTMLLLAALPD